MGEGREGGRTGWAEMAGRAERVRAPIGGCLVVLLNGGEGGKGGKSGKSGKGGKGGNGGKGIGGCNIVLLNY